MLPNPQFQPMPNGAAERIVKRQVRGAEFGKLKVRNRCNAATTSCLTDSLPVQVLNRSCSHHSSQDATDLPMLPGPTPTYPLGAISLGTP